MVKGLGIEVKEFGVVGIVMAIMFPAYVWISKAPNGRQMIGRSALVASALVTGAVAEGLRRRK